jgi:hypothetical protein
LVSFSQLIVEQPQIREIDINPLLVSPEGMIALDARVLLHTTADFADRPVPAILPYPTKYVQQWESRKGDRIKTRPIPPRRRAAYGAVPSKSLRRERLFALCSYRKADAAHCSRTVDPNLFY